MSGNGEGRGTILVRFGKAPDFQIRTIDVEDVSVAVGRGIWGRGHLLDLARRNPRIVFIAAGNPRDYGASDDGNKVVLSSCETSLPEGAKICPRCGDVQPAGMSCLCWDNHSE